MPFAPFRVALCALLSTLPAAAASDSILRRLGVSAGEVVSLTAPAAPGGFVALSIDATRLRGTLELHPVDWRAPSFALRVQGEDGVIRAVVAPAAHTYQGTVRGRPGSLVAAAVVPAGLRIAVWFAEGGACFLEPATTHAAGAGPVPHVLYRDDEVLAPRGETCGADRLPSPPSGPAALPATGGPARGGASGTCIRVAELALDADVEYFRRFGSVAAVTAHLDAIVNAVNAIYARDVLIRHEITELLVRTAEPDPYDQSDSGALLNQFRDHWNTQQSHRTYDVAHLFTGRDLDGNIIGLAWVSVVCTSSRYALSQYLTNHASEIGVLAHELGHNWAAPHCLDPTPCNAMCGACHVFGPVTIGVILDHAASRTCLHAGPPHPTPLPPLARPDRALTVGARTIDVLANDYDGNCEDVFLHAFDAASQAGGRVVRSVGSGPGGRDEVRYDPPAGFAGLDRFQVVIRDAAGATASSTVEVEVLDGVPDPVLHFGFDELTGRVCRDLAGQGRDGTYQQGVVLGLAGAASGSGTAAGFDGVNDRVAVANDPGLDALRHHLSVAAWIRPERVTGNQRLFGNQLAWLFGLRDGDPIFTVAGEPGLTVPVGLVARRWVHVVVSFDVDRVATFWVDGVRVGTAAGTRSSGAPLATWYVGASPTVPQWYQGRIDDLQVYDAPLDDADVLHLFQNPGARLCTPSSSNYGVGVAGQLGVPALTLDRRPRTGTTVNVQVGNGFGLPAPGSLVFGFRTLQLPLLGGTLLVDPFFALTLTIPREGLSLPVVLPPDPALWCQSFYFQAMHLDLAGRWAMSRGLAVHVGR